MESEKKKKKAKEKQPEKVIEVKSVRKIYRMGKEKIDRKSTRLNSSH